MTPADTRKLTPPDRLNEDWRFGRPHVWARELLDRLEKEEVEAGSVGLGGSVCVGDLHVGAPLPAEADMPSIGSDYLVKKLLDKSPQWLKMSIAQSNEQEQPFSIRCEATGLYLACIDITIEPGVHAHILEEHVHRGDTSLICLRRYTVMPGGSLSLELREQGSGSSRALNITHLTCMGGSARQLTMHTGHLWAREECTAELTTQSDSAPELLLLSANRLQGKQTLDQRTLQRHLSPGAKSRLLYKNVLDDHATAIFGGNIRVEPKAHETDAYLSNLNMMLSEHACVHSLPGLEILADRVRCSHGSATAPLDPEQLFYLLSRGIDSTTAHNMVADGFLADVQEQFRA